MYSTIKKKHCRCIPNCKFWPTMGYEGYNRQHAPIEIKEKQDGKTQRQRTEANKRKLSKVRSLIANPSEEDNKLQLWFKYQMQVSKKECENCKTDLSGLNERDWYGCQHHIIEKSLCPSVASHPLNHMVLGRYCCHKHDSWLNMSKMACYEEMKRRFDLFKGDIAENELSKLHKHPFLIQVP